MAGFWSKWCFLGGFLPPPLLFHEFFGVFHVSFLVARDFCYILGAKKCDFRVFFCIWAFLKTDFDQNLGIFHSGRPKKQLDKAILVFY